MRRAMRIALAAAIVWWWAAASARAACDPPAGNNVTATCTGTTTDQNTPNGYGTGTETNLSTTVVSGASVSGTNSGITFDTGGVTNFGTITGGFVDGIRATTATVTNSGTISGVLGGIFANNTATVTNSGTISGEFGIFANNTATVTNSGTITGTSEAGIAATIATVTNSGTISGTNDDGIFAHTATVTNSGTISGDVNGIFAFDTATVTNSGTISGDVNGIFTFGDTATVTNFGTITGTSGNGIGANTANVTNFGTISGGLNGIDANTANVTNFGTITGTSGNGIDANTANVTNFGTISGTSSNGIDANTANVTNFGSIAGGLNGISSATTATVTNSGIISGGNFGIISFNTATVTNSGIISGGLNGISSANTATLTNSGIISGGNFGIFVGTATVTNSGTISGGTGIFALTATVTNSGTIAGGDGIRAATATVTNSGSITGSFEGILANNTATVTNSGTITGTSSAGIEATIATVTNSGTIAGGNFGIDAGTANVTNSGRISGGIAALNFFGGHADTLTLLPGSTIVGAINLGGGGDTVNFRTGNQNLTFDTLAGATVTSTVPFAVAGNQVATIDPTPFAVLDRNLMDFSRAVSQALPDDAGFAGAAAGPATAFAAASPLGEAVIPGLSAYAADAAGIFKAPTVRYADGRTLWARGFAGERVQEADGVLLHTVNRFYGGMLGGDWPAWSDWRLGAFVGAGEIRSSVDFNYGETRSTLAFGGLYGRRDWGPWFLRLAVQGGHSSNDVDRTINNNLAPDGIERATASFAGWYVSPEARVGFHHGLGTFGGASYTLTPSLSLRYVHASFDGYTESGTTAPLTVGRRVVDDFEQRGEVKLSRRQVFGGTAALTTSVFGGVLAVERAGDANIDAALLGQAIPFATPGKDDVWGGYGGVGLEWRTGRVTLYASAQYLGLSDSSSVVSGQGGLRVSF